ncbi:hypothetical protein BH11PLA1_BH11PLA1_07950 [soil metagenome]
MKTKNCLTACALLLAAGLSSTAMAQYTAPTFNLTVSNFEWASTNLNGPGIPVANYSLGSCRFNWTGDAFSASVDANWALASLPATGGTSLNGVTYANRGSAPNSAGTNAPVLLNWPSANLDAVYAGGNPLHYYYRQNFPGSNANWNNIVLTLAGATPPPAPPTNDACANAIVIATAPFTTPPIAVSGASNATTGDPAFACATNVRRTIFYKFTPDHTASYTISTCAADAPGTDVADTVIGVYTGSCGTLTAVGCNDNSGCGARAAVTMELAVGTQYTIVAGRSGTDDPLPVGENAISFSIGEFTPPVGAANDDCTNAIVIPSAATTYLSPAVDLTNATRVNEPASLGTCTDNFSHTVWWKFTPATSAQYSFSTCAADAPENTRADTYLAIYTGACGSLVATACNDDACGLRSTVSATMQAGTTYYILGASYGVADVPAGFSNLQFRMTQTVAPTAPTNDACTDAIVIPPTGSYLSPAIDLGGATRAGDDPAPTCQANFDRTVWWKITPAATQSYTFSTCAADAPATTRTDTILSVYTGTCGALTPVACNDDAGANCAGLRASLTTTLSAGTTYFVQGASYNTGFVPAGGNAALQLSVVTSTPPVPPTCTYVEVEPNDVKAAATPAGGVTGMTAGQAICGNAGAGAVDIFKVKTPVLPGITRHRLVISADNTTTAENILGLTQTAGVVNAAQATVQTSIAAARYVQWYASGNSADPNARSLYVSFTGGVPNYTATLENLAITPTNIAGGSLAVGSITFSTVGQTTADTDLWLYDSAFNAIPDAGNDDNFNDTILQSAFTRTLTAGTYYLAVGGYNIANNLPSPADDDFRAGNVMDFAGVLATSNATIGQDRDIAITDTVGTRNVTVTTSEAFEIPFLRIVVGGGTTVARCQPADIADDQGNPLPPPPGVPNNGVNEGDYNLFFNSFFTNQAIGSPADIADDQGTALPPFGTGGQAPAVNSGVNEGDYNAFFNNFFNGCPV